MFSKGMPPACDRCAYPNHRTGLIGKSIREPPSRREAALGLPANQPRVKGGVLFVDSADKAARFVWLCDAFNIPLLFLADVPGFMIGTAVERAGIIRRGAKMVATMSEATVPKVCVVVWKANGAGLYTMCGPAFEPECTLALPTASIAVMGRSTAPTSTSTGSRPN
jgi:methylmalonyl-CoA decarboxylase subunit alpha